MSAVGLALMDTARRQKRDFAAVFFNGEVVSEFRFEKGKAPPAEILRFAQVCAGGGTDFEPPLAWALSQLETARFQNADITVITDGAGSPRCKVLRWITPGRCSLCLRMAQGLCRS